MTDTTLKPDNLATTVDTHLEAYCEPDAARRASLIASVWAADGEIVDPPIDGRGHDGIAALVDVLLELYPDHRFGRTTEIDAHHDYARYGWALVAPDGSNAMMGIDVARFDANGKLTAVVGFIGDLAPRGGSSDTGG
jgi:SnoaL-like domain